MMKKAHRMRSRTMNTMIPISSGENAGLCVFDEVEFVGALVGSCGAVGDDVGDAVNYGYIRSG